MVDPAQFEQILLLEDEPVPGFRVDELGLVPFAKVVAGVAVGTGGPFTIGVFADWGEGKTSVLRQAKTVLDHARPDVATVWFNAWQYEKEDHPIIPLVATIVRAVERKLAEASEKGPGEAMIGGLKKIARALRAIAYGFSAKVKVPVPGFAEIEAGFVAKEMIERYEKLEGRDDPLIQRTLYYHAFETLQAATGPQGPDRPKIVVFVDDLDRCLPPQGVKLLESIKLVLSQPGFIFVLAVDRRIIEGYLVKRYKDEFGIAAYEEGGKSYLDKIVQLPLPLPPHRSRFEQYIHKLLERPTFQDANQPVRKALEGLAGVLAVGSNYNPRNLVRFINNLIVDRNIWIAVGRQPGAEEEAEVDAPLLALCAVSRILRQHLGDRLYNFLVASNDICESLAGGDEAWQGLRKKTAAAAPGELAPAEESARRLLRRFDELPFLKELLGTGPGRRWLREHQQRQQVNEFLVAQREEARPELRSSEGIIEEAIRRELNKPEGAITEDDRKSIQRLDLQGTQVSDLSPLAGLGNLQLLALTGTQVSDLSPLAGLSKLQRLDLRGTQVSDLSPLGGLGNLQWLLLGDTQVSDLSPLAGLSNLQRLYLGDTKVSAEQIEELQSRLPDCRISR